MARVAALATALAVALLAVAGAGGAATQQAPKRGGTVVFGPIAEPRCLNPVTVEACGGGIPTFFWIMEKVVEPAFLMAPDLTMRPRLVSEARFTRRPPFSVTYVIHPQARWSDGVAVTARDFVFTHQAIRRYQPQSELHRLVRSVRVVGARTFKVVLERRSSAWRELLFGFVLPRHALARENLERIWTDRIDDPRTGRPIGTGPFLVERWERGEQITLVRNRRYRGPHAARLERLVVRFCQEGCSSSEVLSTLQRGEVTGGLSRDTAIVADLRRLPKTRIRTIASNGWEHLDLRVGAGGHPALRNKLVRRALAYGVDRVAISRRLFGDLDRQSTPSDSAAFLNSSRYYQPNWSGYRYRPALARSLLERAGCRPGPDGVYSCAGERLSLRLLTTAGSRLRTRGVELVQQHLRRAGVEARLTFVTGSALIGQVLPAGDFDAVSFTWFVGYSIAGKAVFGCGGSQNYSGHCQRLVTGDLDQAERIMDDRQRARALNRIDRRLARDVPVIPLYQVPFVVALRDDLRGVVAAPNNLFWNAEDWWIDD